MGRAERSGARPAIVALVGLRCSGKTTVGRALAGLLGRGFVDLDDEIALLAGAETAGAVLEELGLETFRRLEARALERVLTEGADRRGDLGVLATGGGVVEGAVNRQWLGLRTRCVWLQADVELLRARLRADPNGRPSLTGADPAEELEHLAARRAALYAEVAELRVDVGARDPLELARHLQRELARP